MKCREDSSVARELTQAGSLTGYIDDVITLIIHELTKARHGTLAGFYGRSYSADGNSAQTVCDQIALMRPN